MKSKTKNRNKNLWLITTGMLIGLLLGWGLFSNTETHEHISSEETESGVWTCSMHPQIRQHEAGSCPICGMDLIPVEKDSTPKTSNTIRMTDYALRLANVRTIEVGSENTHNEIHLNGKVAVDERLTYSQSSHIPGRIEKLFVNFTGKKVNRGQVLARVYSPQLITAQEELLQTYALRESNPRLFQAARKKLKNWKISEAHIQRILEQGSVEDQFNITADVSGVVTQKLVKTGDYVERGMPIYEITDLSKIWILFDVYENQMSSIRKGSEVQFNVASLPGKTFSGEVEFIDPLISSETRVSTARVAVKNPSSEHGEILKPGMLVTGIIKNPMEKTDIDQISIPNSAILWTGKRSVVYVRESPGVFEMREVVLGTSLGDNRVVTEGLEAGEEVVVNGAFTIDAAAQLAGKPSMMNTVTENDNTNENHRVKVSEESKQEFVSLLKEYFQLKESLVNDDFKTAKKEIEELSQQLEKIEISALDSTVKKPWENFYLPLKGEIQSLQIAGNIESIRASFDELSLIMIELVESFSFFNREMYIQYCPMVNKNTGAHWLSLSSEIRNPYFGESMLNCGEVEKKLN